MPKGAKVFLAEDHDLIRKQEKELLTELGHTVEIEATSLEEALAFVKLAKERGIEVAVLDGCLTKTGPWKADGKVIAEALKREIPSIKIISCSGILQDWGDVNLVKDDAVKLGEIIDKL